MRAVFTKKQREDTITHDGYLVVDFLNPDELEEVQKGTRELGFGMDHEKKLRMSVVQDSVEKRNEIFEKLSPVFQRAADKCLHNYKVVRIGIFDKLPGGGDIRIHQHPNLVDESKYRSFTIWIPLTDTTVDMGTLHVVKGSHKFVNYVRSYDDIYNAFGRVSPRLMRKYSTPLLLKAGQAVVFDDRLTHWSPPNKTSIIRTAFQLELIPQEAKLMIHYRANDKELSQYDISDEFYRATAVAHGKPDGLQEIGKINQPAVNYSNKQFIAMIHGVNPDERLKRNLFQRLFNL